MRIEFTCLTKLYDGVRVVDCMTATAEPGRITAFLGPNGAGKTTTLRMLLGLVAPSAGHATIGGRRYDELPEPVRHVGAVLEAAGCHPGRTALDHLRILAHAARLPVEAPMRTLDAVGLTSHARRRVGGFSLGMRQRLGLAAAMLGDPSVLVLDEPTNGLDPDGVRWFRRWVREMAAEGRTVLLSSHALSDVEQIADDVLVIDRGRLVRSDSLAAVRAEAGVRSQVRTPDLDRLSMALDAEHRPYRRIEDGLLIDAAPEDVGELAARHGVVLHTLIGTGALEDAFFRLLEQTGATEQTGDLQGVFE